MNPFKGGLGDLMQQAAKMREEVQRIQEEAGRKTIETRMPRLLIVKSAKESFQGFT